MNEADREALQYAERIIAKVAKAHELKAKAEEAASKKAAPKAKKAEAKSGSK